MKRLTKIKPVDGLKRVQPLGSKKHKLHILRRGPTNFPKLL